MFGRFSSGQGAVACRKALQALAGDRGSRGRFHADSINRVEQAIELLQGAIDENFEDR